MEQSDGKMLYNYFKNLPVFIKRLRDEETIFFRKLFKNIKNKDIVDIGCGINKYLKYLLHESNIYTGIDLFDTYDKEIIQMDANDLTYNFLKNKFVVSLGLFYILTDLEKIELLKKIKHGIIQFNRLDSMEGINLLYFDFLQYNLSNYFVTEKSLKKILEKSNINNYIIKKTSCSYIIKF